MSLSIFTLAGEASGDVLGGALMRELKAQKPDIRFVGVGGESMQKAGLQSMLPMEELCVMGIVEVLEHLPRLLKLINGMVEEIEKLQPDIVLTIDLPDFNFRVAEKLKKRGKYKGKIIHYVAPTVWAWRPGRAKHIAQFLDGLLCLFPFEPDYFTPHGLKASYVGHPLIENTIDALDPQAFRAQHDIPADAPLLCVLFGSRASEFKAHSGIFMNAIDLIAEQVPNLHIVTPTAPNLQYSVLDALSRLNVPAFQTLTEADKWAAFRAANAGIAASGTVALELAYARLPHMIGYRTHPISWLLIRLLVKSKYAHLANIMLDKPAVPELLQFAFSDENVAKEVLKLLQDEQSRSAQLSEFEALRDILGVGGAPPSQQAAQAVLALIAE